MNIESFRIGNFIDTLTPANPVKMPRMIPMKIVAINPFNVDLISPNDILAQVSKPVNMHLMDVCELENSIEWLWRFGFKETRNNLFIKNNVSVDPESMHVWAHGVLMTGKRLKYVHELQNFYFAIQSIELTT